MTRAIRRRYRLCVSCPPTSVLSTSSPLHLLVARTADFHDFFRIGGRLRASPAFQVPREIRTRAVISYYVVVLLSRAYYANDLLPSWSRDVKRRNAMAQKRIYETLLLFGNACIRMLYSDIIYHRHICYGYVQFCHSIYDYF